MRKSSQNPPKNQAYPGGPEPGNEHIRLRKRHKLALHRHNTQTRGRRKRTETCRQFELTGNNKLMDELPVLMLLQLVEAIKKICLHELEGLLNLRTTIFNI